VRRGDYALLELEAGLEGMTEWAGLGNTLKPAAMLVREPGREMNLDLESARL
jgi:hypothetical protein